MLSSRNLLMLTGLGALLATVVLFAGVLARPGLESTLLTADAAPNTSSIATTPGAAPSARADAKTPFATDERGFVSYAARCDESQTAVAFGRTSRSLVAICANADGGYEYRGVRVSDGAALTAAAEAADGGFAARSDDATYSVTAAELLVTAGGKTVYRDTWIEYQEPRFAAEHGGTATPSSTAPAEASRPVG